MTIDKKHWQAALDVAVHAITGLRDIKKSVDRLTEAVCAVQFEERAARQESEDLRTYPIEREARDASAPKAFESQHRLNSFGDLAQQVLDGELDLAAVDAVIRADVELAVCQLLKYKSDPGAPQMQRMCRELAQRILDGTLSLTDVDPSQRTQVCRVVLNTLRAQAVTRDKQATT